MEKTKEEIIVEIFRQFTPANKRNFMKMLGVAVNAEHNMRTSMENEQARTEEGEKRVRIIWEWNHDDGKGT